MQATEYLGLIVALGAVFPIALLAVAVVFLLTRRHRGE